jgi:hypothetical protein
VTIHFTKLEYIMHVTGNDSSAGKVVHGAFSPELSNLPSLQPNLANDLGASTSIPLRKFGRHDVRISALGFGGHHLGDAQDQPTAARIVHEAIDGGITFFDNCW